MTQYIQRCYRVKKHHDIAVKKVAKKLKISESEVVRRRLKTFDEMLVELREDMKHDVDLNRM